jgi:uncharacterized membrane protein
MLTRLAGYLRKALIGGVVVVLPLFVFVNLLLWLIGSIVEQIAPVATFAQAHFGMPLWWAQTLTIAAIVIACSALGVFVSTRFGNRAFNWLEANTVQRIPGYRPVKEIVSYLGKRDQNPFTRPVLVSVAPGLRFTGFLADDGPAGTTVFIPTGPNPTTGLVIHVEPHNIERLPVAGSDAVKTILACGAGSQRLLRLTPSGKARSAS